MCLAGLAADALKHLMQAQQILLCEGGSCIMSLSFHIWIKNNNTFCVKAPFSTLRDTVQTFTCTQDTPQERKTRRIKGGNNKNDRGSDGGGGLKQVGE